jgi:hypothetical protein
VVSFGYKKEFEPFGLGGKGNRTLPADFEPFGLGGRKQAKHIGVITQEV